MSDEIIKGLCIEGEIVDVPADALSVGVFTADPPDPDEPSTMHIDADGCITIDPESQGQAPESIPEAVQQAAEAQPAPIIETPQSPGDHGRMTLEAQTVRHLCRLRVGRSAEVELLMDGESCPVDEVVLISEHNWREHGRLWGHISALHGTSGRPLWWTPRQDAAVQRWMKAMKWLIEERRKKHDHHLALLVGGKGKTRRG